MIVEDLRRAAWGDRVSLDALARALRGGESAPIASLAELSPAEAARLILQVKPKEARALLRALPDAPSLAVVAELDPAIRQQLLQADDQERIAKIVARLPVDEAADFLAGAPPKLITAALAGHPEAPAVRAAIDFRQGTAGAVMRHRLVAVPVDWTLGEVLDDIRRHSDRIDKLYAVYAVDAERRLKGYLKLRDLLLYPPETRVGEVIRLDPVAVSADADRAEVARLAAREHLPVLPVTDANGMLLGLVTAEELLAIERSEAQEDMAIMSGLDPDATAADGPFQIVRRRLPWLAGGLVGAGVAAIVVGAYEDALTQAAILASLIPIVMSLAGNAGIQASTVTVQAISSGALWIGDVRGRVAREVGGALLNGGAVGLITAAGILTLSRIVEIDNPGALALTAVCTLMVVTLQASVVGSMVPLALERLKLDPAVATGVFITTSNDVVGVLIFFLIATTLYL